MYTLTNYLIKIIVINAVSVLACPNSASKLQCKEYKYKNYENRTSILSTLPDTRCINEISLTGTHQSMTHSTADLKLRKQELNITEQLTYGVRVFDITLKINLNFFDIYSHGVPLNNTFTNLMYEINAFLKLYPREFVVMIINTDYYGNHDFTYGPHNNYCDLLNNHCTDYVGGQRLVKYWSLDSTLGELRGKILLLTDDIHFQNCVSWIKSKCLLSNDITIPYNRHRGFNIDGDIEYKWNRFRTITTYDELNMYACYVYDLSVYDHNYYSNGVAKYGGYYHKDDNECVEPMNHRIIIYNFFNHQRKMNIFILDYVTQEIIDLINDQN